MVRLIAEPEDGKGATMYTFADCQAVEDYLCGRGLSRLDAHYLTAYHLLMCPSAAPCGLSWTRPTARTKSTCASPMAACASAK